jgi:hypothetical protein
VPGCSQHVAGLRRLRAADDHSPTSDGCGVALPTTDQLDVPPAATDLVDVPPPATDQLVRQQSPDELTSTRAETIRIQQQIDDIALAAKIIHEQFISSIKHMTVPEFAAITGTAIVESGLILMVRILIARFFSSGLFGAAVPVGMLWANLMDSTQPSFSGFLAEHICLFLLKSPICFFLLMFVKQTLLTIQEDHVKPAYAKNTAAQNWLTSRRPKTD